MSDLRVLLAVAAVAVVWLVWRWWPKSGPAAGYLDRQVAAVQGGRWTRSRVMNRPELRLYRIVFEELGGEYLVLPQVSLGEYLHTEGEEAFRAINSKRCDLLITDLTGMPLTVVEYQGSGHDLDGTASRRDLIKRMACEAAGINYVEIAEGTQAVAVREVLRGLVRTLAA